jgi:hypothetical protein
MRLVEVDVVGPQASQRGVDLLADLGRRQATVGRVVRHLAPHLGRQHIGAARAAGKDPAPRRLGCAAAIHVGGVEEVDAGLERSVGAGAGLLQAHAAREGQPRAEGDLRDLQVRGAEPAVVHDAPCRRRAAGWRARAVERAVDRASGRASGTLAEHRAPPQACLLSNAAWFSPGVPSAARSTGIWRSRLTPGRRR